MYDNECEPLYIHTYLTNQAIHELIYKTCWTLFLNHFSTCIYFCVAHVRKIISIGQQRGHDQSVPNNPIPLLLYYCILNSILQQNDIWYTYANWIVPKILFPHIFIIQWRNFEMEGIHYSALLYKWAKSPGFLCDGRNSGRQMGPEWIFMVWEEASAVVGRRTLHTISSSFHNGECIYSLDPFLLSREKGWAPKLW